jgi:hypothetical protein
MVRFFVALIASMTVAQSIAGAQTVLKPGIYSGRAKCSTSANGSFPMYWKWRIFPNGGWVDVFDSEGWGADFSYATPTSHTYTTWYNIYGLVPGDSENYESFTSALTVATNGAASIAVSGINGPEGTHEGRCSARLTFSPAANNFSLSSDGGRFTSKCYNVLPRASMYFMFRDRGGFLASMTMYAKPCGRGARRRLIDFKKWVETYAKDEVIKLPAGRYRFEGSSTGYWLAESMMGLSR